MTSSPKHFIDQRIIIFTLLILGLILTCFVYWSGLSGPFLLDDTLHLPKLKGQDGQIDTWLEVMELTFSGSGASGRPLSFLSLLINDNAWPTTPFGFKYTNLCFHLINGLLLFLLVYRLGNYFQQNERSLYLALFVSVIWLVHPINLSAVLFSIQRMTILMAACNLVGLIIYAKGRFDYECSPRKRYALLVSGCVVGVGVGVLFKETAVMMMVYLLALEFLAYSQNKNAKMPFFAVWKFLLWVPLVFVCLYFIASLDHMNQLYLKRDFSPLERLMTEMRVLVDYMRLIFLPRISEMGPYHDDYVVSKSFFEPITTLTSFLMLSGLIVAALFLKARYPILLFSVVGFLGAHALESTILPLELYYEHRNYLPSILLIGAFVYSLLVIKNKLKKFIAPIIFLWFISLVFVSWSSAKVWGDKEKLSNIWIEEHPLSSRARIDAVKYWLTNQDIERAFELLEDGVRMKPMDAGLLIYGYIVQHCNTIDSYNEFSFTRMSEVIPVASFDHGSLDAVRWLMKNYKDRCSLTLSDLEKVILLYLSNEKFYGVSPARAVLYHSLSEVYKLKGQLSPTIESLEKAYEARPRYEFVLQAASYLSMAGNFEQATYFLERAKKTNTDNLLTERVKSERIKKIEEIIKMKKTSSQITQPLEDF